MKKALSQKVSNTGKLSGEKLPMPPEGSSLMRWFLPSKRLWQCASAAVQVR